MNIAIDYVMSYLQDRNIDKLESTLADNCVVCLIGNGKRQCRIDENGSEIPKIQTKEELLRHFRQIFMYKLKPVKIRELHYCMLGDGEYKINVISEQSREEFPANCVNDTITFKVKEDKIISVEHNFEVTRPGWSEEELERSRALYEELCEKYETC